MVALPHQPFLWFVCPVTMLKQHHVCSVFLGCRGLHQNLEEEKEDASNPLNPGNFKKCKVRDSQIPYRHTDAT